MRECRTQGQLLYVVLGVNVIPYLDSTVLINIISKEDIGYRVTIDNMFHYSCPDSQKKSSQSLRKNGKWVCSRHLYYVFRFLCKVDVDSDKFIHVVT